MAKQPKGAALIEKTNKSLEVLKIEYVDVGILNPNSYNPNRQSEHEFELLCRSITEDGFTQPVIVMREGNVIVDGEHRWRAARHLGYEQIPVVFVDMTPEQMRISTLRHNRARGSEDVDLVANVLRDLRDLGALDWAQDSLMLDDIEVQRLIEEIPAPEALAGDEFGNAWEPTTQLNDADGNSVLNVEGSTSTDGKTTSAMTPAAADKLRETEKKIEAAKTEEERQSLKRESAIYRFTLVFSGQEGRLVKKVLGNKPAVKIVELCRLWATQEGIEIPGEEEAAAEETSDPEETEA